MNQRGDEFRVQPVRTKGVNRAVPILTFVVGIFLGAAIVKPWDLVFPPTQASIPAPAATAGAIAVGTAAPSPTPTRDPAECVFAGGWRVFALAQPDQFGGDGSADQVVPSGSPARFADIANPLRRWLEVDPLSAASGPGDVHIPFVTIVSDRIGGIGYCPPPEGTDGPPASARFDAWALDPAGTPTPLPLEAVNLGPASTIQVAVFIGADHPAGLNERWAPGRYVFAVVSPNDGVYSRWFGVEIRTPPGKLAN